jgi:cytidyltransferase-like protein
MMKQVQVAVSGSFDDFRSSHVRFLHEASRQGPVTVFLWSDGLVESFEGHKPKLPLEERQYLLDAIRYVDRVVPVDSLPQSDVLPDALSAADLTWVVDQSADSAAKQAVCRDRGIGYRVLAKRDLAGFPEHPPAAEIPGHRRVIVTGCYDWFHSGHVRFFEEVAAMGDLYVVVGHDANIKLLKGEGHPLFPQEERRYLVGAVRCVHQALISSGNGWLDAEPEIERIRPQIYAVNEDGDRPEKRAYCEARGIEYRVLKRTPKPGLPRRQSTNLRGF